jgi:Protein of unknown function (DUF2752)
MIKTYHNQDQADHSINYDRHDSIFFERAKYLAVIVISAITIAISRFLEPSVRGIGTHEQLGLPPCPFFIATGFPCPGCGLTTSFAHAARLNFYEASVTQPFGLLLFVILTLSIPLFVILLCRRIKLSQVLAPRLVSKLAYSLILFCLISWIYKIIVMR